MYGRGDEPFTRQIELWRGRREARAARHEIQQRDKASRVGTFRRYRRISFVCKGNTNQDGAGFEARRGRTFAGQESLSVDCADTIRDSGRFPHFSAPAPRHLFYRRLGAAHLRPQKRQPRRAYQRKIGERSGSRNDCVGSRKGRRASHLDFRTRRRHGRSSDFVDTSRRLAVGTWSSGNAPNAPSKRLALSCHHRNRRQIDERARCRDSSIARRGGIRLCNCSAHHDGLFNDESLSARHLPVRSCDAKRKTALSFQRKSGIRRKLYALHRRRNARDYGKTRREKRRGAVRTNRFAQAQRQAGL